MLTDGKSGGERMDRRAEIRVCCTPAFRHQTPSLTQCVSSAGPSLLQRSRVTVNLPEFVRQGVIGAASLERSLEGVEPPFAGYRRTWAALLHYLHGDRLDG
jgi:hypothetical protein